jgi:hypothetical protein
MIARAKKIARASLDFISESSESSIKSGAVSSVSTVGTSVSGCVGKVRLKVRRKVRRQIVDLLSLIRRFVGKRQNSRSGTVRM